MHKLCLTSAFSQFYNRPLVSSPSPFLRGGDYRLEIISAPFGWGAYKTDKRHPEEKGLGDETKSSVPILPHSESLP